MRGSKLRKSIDILEEAVQSYTLNSKQIVLTRSNTSKRCQSCTCRNKEISAA